MSDLLKLFTNPINLLGLLIVGALLSRYFKRKGWFRLFAFMAILYVLLTCTNPLPNYLVNQLEHQYPPFDPAHHELTGKSIHILVLGAGYTYDPTLPPNSCLSSNSLARVVEGIRIHRLLPESTLVFSGKGRKGEPSIAQAMQETALSLGVDKNNTHVLVQPATTAQEADEYLHHFGTNTHLIIATSAIHTPRAMLTFSKRQLSPLAAPTNPTNKNRLGRSSTGWLGFSAGNMRKLEKALREMLAIRYERMTE